MALEQVAYSHDGKALTGWLARPGGTPRGAVLVWPNIANMSRAFERRAIMLADAGFVAMVGDFYGDPVADFGASFAMGGELREDVDHYRARLLAGLNALRDHEAASGLKIASTGYCMGGQAALELARMGEDLVAVVSYHGALSTDRKAGDHPVKPRLLICHGDADPLVPREQVLAFWDEMDAAGAAWHFHSYSGVKHGFTEPGAENRGVAALAYDASADRQSWAATMSLFDEVF